MALTRSRRSLNPQSRAQHRGHTLAELMVTLSAVAVVALVCAQFYVAISDGISSMYAQSTLQTALGRGMRSVLDDSRMALGLAPSCTTYIGNLTPGDNLLCLRVAGTTATGGSTVDIIAYRLVAASGTLQRIVTPGTNSTRVAATDIVATTLLPLSGTNGGAIFDTATAGSVICTLRGQRVERNRPYTFTITSRARFRNTS